VPYFHVVFTLPPAIGDVAKAVIYDLLFEASAETMRIIAADPKHLGARIGITAVSIYADQLSLISAGFIHTVGRLLMRAAEGSIGPIMPHLYLVPTKHAWHRSSAVVFAS
jgi:hypothetical protein